MPTPTPDPQRFTFGSIFKNSFLENFSLTGTAITPVDIALTLALAFALGMFIYFIYRRTYKGVIYSHTFNTSLVMLCMITAMVIMCITSNPMLSLGMVGALSIVRFRTAVKDPNDTVFMFFSIGAGICAGARLYEFAVISVLVVGGIMLLLSMLTGRGAQSYLLVIHYEDAATGEVTRILQQITKRRIKSKTVTRNGVELTVEVRLHDENTHIVDSVLQVDGVYDATLVAYQADLT